MFQKFINRYCQSKTKRDGMTKKQDVVKLGEDLYREHKKDTNFLEDYIKSKPNSIIEIKKNTGSTGWLEKISNN